MTYRLQNIKNVKPKKMWRVNVKNQQFSGKNSFKNESDVFIVNRCTIL